MPFADNQGVKIHYFVDGDGPDLFWIHGAGGNGGAWAQQISHFAKTHRCIVMDQRFFGKSGAPEAPPTADDLRTDALAVLDAAGSTQADVICQSLGGWAGAQIALNTPERVGKLVLSCTMAGIGHGPALEAVQASLGNMDERGPASVALAPDFHRTDPAKAYLYEQIGAFNVNFGQHVLANLLDPNALVSMDALAGIELPVLLINGSEDLIWPPASLAGIAEALPRGRQIILQGSGHSPYWEMPDQFNQLVTEFLNG